MKKSVPQMRSLDVLVATTEKTVRHIAAIKKEGIRESTDLDILNTKLGFCNVELHHMLAERKERITQPMRYHGVTYTPELVDYCFRNFLMPIKYPAKGSESSGHCEALPLVDEFVARVKRMKGKLIRVEHGEPEREESDIPEHFCNRRFQRARESRLTYEQGFIAGQAMFAVDKQGFRHLGVPITNYSSSRKGAGRQEDVERWKPLFKGKRVLVVNPNVFLPKGTCERPLVLRIAGKDSAYWHVDYAAPKRSYADMFIGGGPPPSYTLKLGEPRIKIPVTEIRVG